MGKMYKWLDRHKNESVREFENRINQYPPQHVGYIFFDRVNYDAVRQIFAVYAVWNGELNAKFQDALPDGGFEMECSRAEADAFCTEICGIPIFVKLFAKAGRIYSRHLFIQYREKKYQVYFTGCEVKRPEFICFRGVRQQENFEDTNQQSCPYPEGEGYGSGSHPLHFLAGSRFPGSGSYSLHLLSGSRFSGSGSHPLHPLSGSRGFQSSRMLSQDTAQDMEYWKDLFGIGGLGYGLNLI